MTSTQDLQKAEAVLRRQMGDSFYYLTEREKTELLSQLMRRPRR